MKRFHTEKKSAIVTELQRIKSSITHLHRNLESYLCAPKTEQLFEKKRVLETKLKSVDSNTDDLITTLKTNEITDQNYITDVELQFDKFNSLRKEIQEYVKTVR